MRGGQEPVPQAGVLELGFRELIVERGRAPVDIAVRSASAALFLTVGGDF